MGRIKSLHIPAKVEVAQRSHDCKRNSEHRIQRGDKRLAVHNGQGWSTYCSDCARKMIRRNIEESEALDSELTGEKTGGQTPDR